MPRDGARRGVSAALVAVVLLIVSVIVALVAAPLILRSAAANRVVKEPPLHVGCSKLGDAWLCTVRALQPYSGKLVVYTVENGEGFERVIHLDLGSRGTELIIFSGKPVIAMASVGGRMVSANLETYPTKTMPMHGNMTTTSTQQMRRGEGGRGR